jgi:peptide chain release factor 3
MAEVLREQAGLVQSACPAFYQPQFLEGTLTPMSFGNALRDFGVAHRLDGLACYAPPPPPRRAEEEWPMIRFHAVREQHGLDLDDP